jgi:glycosyltransferase involved in cell wall biosynthesis
MDHGRHPQPVRRAIDGVLCFGGEDWWYHNRGHYDMRMMRELATHVPVVYVNSVGMRVPRPTEGRMFGRRIARKARSLVRGRVAVDDRFTVCTLPVLPTPAAMHLARPIAMRALRSALRAAGIDRPLVWVACPAAAPLVEALPARAIVYQRTDRYECFDGVDRDRVARYDAWLKERADATLFCSDALLEEEAADCRQARFVDHGVDFERFRAAGDGETPLPPDIDRLPRPRVGFVGGIDGHTFDPELLRTVAAACGDMHFALVGACSLPPAALSGPNVTLLGRRPYETIERYMAACDALIMPWRRSRWIEACNPVKLKEYLAVGRPVVSTPFPALGPYADVVATAAAPEAFARAVRDALDRPHDPERGRGLVRCDTWTHQADAVRSSLRDLGIRLGPEPALPLAERLPFRAPAPAPLRRAA